PTRWNTSTSSNTGVTTMPYPARLKCSAARAMSACHRSDSGGMTSRVPTGARNASDVMLRKLPVLLGDDELLRGVGVGEAHHRHVVEPRRTARGHDVVLTDAVAPL